MRLESGTDSCATAVLDAAVLVVRSVRREIARVRPAGLSITQVRGLGVVRDHPECTLSELADSIGLGAPTASKFMRDLATRGLVQRRACLEDRRRALFRLTPRGRVALRVALDHTRRHIAGRLVALSHSERESLEAAMRTLHTIFLPCGRPQS